MKPKKLNKWDSVLVTWMDTVFFQSAWVDLEEVTDDAVVKDMLHETVSYYAGEMDEYYIFADTISPVKKGDGSVSGINCIPKGCVKEIRKLS